MPAFTVLLTKNQRGLPNDKVQTGWCLRLNALHEAIDELTAVRAYHNALGYTQALRDAGLIENETELAMTSTLAEVWRPVMERMRANTVGKDA